MRETNYNTQMDRHYTKILIAVLISLAVTLGVIGTFILRSLGLITFDLNSGDTFSSPFISTTPVAELPLLKYSIPRLKDWPFKTSPLTIEKELLSTPTYKSYLFSYQTLDQKMTGQLNVPVASTSSKPAIVLIRGYVPSEIYETGVGTKNAAAFFAEHGYVTVSPDFFGYGGSDPEPKDSWQARFEKPLVVVELLRSLEAQPLITPTQTEPILINTIGMWAHSNGGQIALTTLEALGRNIPTTLWAPVTAPFPYSILFFSDEAADEGKSTRNSIADFEADYDAFDFSLTQHLNLLFGPLQIQHGLSDEAALQVWSVEFIDKIKVENARRKAAAVSSAASATNAATVKVISDPALEPIEVKYFTYPNTDHNMRPNWDIAIQKDLDFFNRHLAQP
jgi:pimeloyl-ACP methyl ester carboxylesterase